MRMFDEPSAAAARVRIQSPETVMPAPEVSLQAPAADSI